MGEFVNQLERILNAVDDIVWGPLMITLLMGTGIFLTLRTRFLPWRNLGYALKCTLSKEARGEQEGEEGDISSFSALTTALAATIGTGNIVGVATAMVTGGPGALVWMWISACFGLSLKFGECMLAIKYRVVNEKGEMSGGPMYAMKHAFKSKRLGELSGRFFAFFTVIASFGIGNFTQANSISESLDATFDISPVKTGLVITFLALVIIVGGIKVISKISSILVPGMAIFYMIAGLCVIIGNITQIPQGMADIIQMAFRREALGGGVAGTVAMEAIRYGVARGVFSNEAGLGSAAISAAAARTSHPVKQGYISMTGTFWDTIVICTITGLAIAASGALGTLNPSTGEPFTGAALTMKAFETVLGPLGSWTVCIGISFFAFLTILGWEYHGEKAFEYLVKSSKYNIIYRILFSVASYIGATTTLRIVWSFSDIANALMAIPNLICLLLLSGEITRDIREYQKILKEN